MTFTKKIGLAAVTLAMSLSALATDITILRQPKNGSTRPFLEAIVEALPAEARKQGINDLNIKFVDFGNAGDSYPLLFKGEMDVFVSSANHLGTVASKIGPDNIKLLSGIGGYSIKLVCSDPSIKTVKDFKPDTKVAFKGVMSTEHFYLKSLAKKHHGSYDALESHIQILPRPQIQQLLESKDKTVSCGIVGTPMQDILIKKGIAHAVDVSDGVNTMGSYMMAMATKEWLDKNPKLGLAWIGAVKQATVNFNKDPKKYYKIWKDVDKVEFEVSDMLEEAQSANQKFSYRPDSVIEINNFLIDIGVIKTEKRTIEQYAWKPELLK